VLTAACILVELSAGGVLDAGASEGTKAAIIAAFVRPAPILARTRRRARGAARARVRFV
jgi:hypothetical protein